MNAVYSGTTWLGRVGVGIALSAAGPALAGSYNLSPTNLSLGEDNHSAILSVDNQGSDELRFHVTSFAWDESEQGEMLLDPTTDLVVFPTLFVLAPGERRQIRVGTTREAGAAEQTYRVIVEELPSLSADGEQGVLVRTRMSVPVFLEPIRGAYSGRVGSVASAGGGVAVTVVNDGTLHFRARKVLVDGRDASGASVYAGSVDGWYVLAGHDRMFEVPLPPEHCAEITSLRVTVETDHGTWRSEVAADPSACRR